MMSKHLSRLFPVFGRLLVVLLLIGHHSARADEDFLQPEKAFQFSSKQLSPDKIEVTFRIANGYYMYRDRFKFDAIGATLGEITIPKGVVKFDETFQKNLETFRGSVAVQVQLVSVDHSQPAFTFITHSQGCSDQGLCYVPMESTQSYDTSYFLTGGSGSVVMDGSDSNKVQSALQSGSVLIIVPLFLLFGLGLAFTPCVLPMVPILSSIIVGEGAKVGKFRGFVLSLSYSLGMALVYTGLGIAAGLLGEGLAATLQNPWVLSAFSLLLVGLSLSMFNIYHLQVPAWLQNKLSHFSERHRTGKLLGVFMMGAISALIVGPCVAAPLATALLYIGQTHDVFVGGIALFSMAMGMSVPLILVGLSAGSILPRAGRWMESVKQLFGVMMLAMALWLLSSVLSSWLYMLAWSGLLIGYSFFLFRYTGVFMKVAALAFCTLGLIQLLGVVTGGRDALAPLAHLSEQPSKHQSEFMPIKSIAELDQALEQAKRQGKTVMLDFYADWCVACKEMEKFTFTDERVQSKFADMVLLRADVTANDDEDRALLKRFNLYGPPGMIFFGLDSKESGRVIGFQNAQKFFNSMSSFIKAAP